MHSIFISQTVWKKNSLHIMLCIGLYVPPPKKFDVNWVFNYYLCKHCWPPGCPAAGSRHSHCHGRSLIRGEGANTAAEKLTPKPGLNERIASGRASRIKKNCAKSNILTTWSAVVTSKREQPKEAMRWSDESQLLGHDHQWWKISSLKYGSSWALVKML